FVSSLLNVRNLTTQFSSGGRTIIAVDGISFEITASETIGIVGESGSGKSVTALSIMRLISSAGKISGGEILFSKEHTVNLLSLPEKEMRHFRGKEIAMIFQEPMTSLNPVFTCGNQVDEATRLHLHLNKKEARERTLKLFEDVKLQDPSRIYRSYPHQLSGGQKQRVMIAMAMSCNPSLLIADEPTTSLDVTVQARILELMNELKHEHQMAMIFISHDLGVVADIADRVLVMYKGKIVEQGSLEEIFSDPKHPYTKGLLACRPPLNKLLRRLPMISDFMQEENGVMTEIAVKIQDVIMRNEISADESSNRLMKLLEQSPLLSVKNLSVTFPMKKSFFGKAKEFVKAVDDVSFDVYPGETVGLVGESGCGKTTLGRAILQLVAPTSGEVIFEEKNLPKLPSEELRKIRKHLQIIFQDPYSSLNPRLTIGYAIMEPMKVHKLFSNDKERKEKALELLDKVKMPADSFNRFPHEFSGGQRQRVCIARALSLSPRFIICDECVSSLDVSVQ
ncbi:MAG: dipeptide ABC transporter ATP-binding protein, partial [Chitinophagales bacterium]